MQINTLGGGTPPINTSGGGALPPSEQDGVNAQQKADDLANAQKEAVQSKAEDSGSGLTGLGQKLDIMG